MKNSFLMLVFSFYMTTVSFAETGTVATRDSVLTFQNSDLKVALTWIAPAPVTGPESQMTVQWMNKAGEPTEIDGDFRVQLWMPMMGHGSSPTKIGKLEGPGLYQVTRIYFTMPGDWEVRVILRLKGQDPEMQAAPVVAPEP